jgi:hypothetical protein
VKITFVKKILADGSPCPKCSDVEKKLIEGQYMGSIDEVIIADERDPESVGMKLAAAHQVTRAPFFIVEQGGEVEVYTVYFKFLKQVLGGKSSKSQEASEILNDNPDLDFL